MNYLVAQNISKSLFDKKLFEDINLSVKKGDRIGLVGKNGSGKSTLLKILSGIELPDSGEITTNNSIKFSYLAQDPNLNSDRSIYEEIYSSESELMKIVRNYHKSLKNPSEEDFMVSAIDKMNSSSAWDFDSKITEIMSELKLDQIDNTIDKLSGGQKKRVSLAKTLLGDFDLLFLDEPTNHLDIESIQWLENYISNQNYSLILISHDRQFLNRVCNSLIEIDDSKLYRYKGNYDDYLFQREQRYITKNIEIERVKSQLAKEKEWINTQPQGRQSKSGARVNAYYEKLSSLPPKKENKKVDLDSVERRLGGKILELHNVVKRYEDRKVINSFNYQFKKGEKIGIVGKNGTGKSTLAKIITGKLEYDSGKIVVGDTVHFGYYEQHQADLNQDQKVIESVREIASIIKLSNGFEISASQLLEKFLFSPREQQNKISKLSGGEKKRVALVRLLMKNPNFMILDEPTNDFDTFTLESLENFLSSFGGNLIIISHDRYFLDKVVDHLLVFDSNGNIREYPGKYSDLLKEENREKKTKATSQPATKPKDSTAKESNRIYRELSKLESRKDKYKKKIYQDGLENEELIKLGKQIDLVEKEIEELTNRWLELNE